MKHRVIFIIIVLWGCYLVLVGHPLPDVQDNNAEQLVKADSLDQLIDLIKSALQEKDSKRLEQIKSQNIELIQGNRYLTTQECSKYLKESIENELSGNLDVGKDYFQIAQILAGIYKDAANSNYLLNKFSIFRKWRKKEKEKYLEAEKYLTLGDFYLNKYNYQKAVVSYNKCLLIFREIRYKEGEANSLKCLGKVSMYLFRNEKALKCYEKGLAIYREIADKSDEAESLLRLGQAYMFLSEHEKARQKYEESLNISIEMNFKLGQAHSLLNLGGVYSILDEYEKARHRYEEGLTIYQEIKHRLGEANCLSGIGNVERLLTKYKSACKYYENGLVIYREIKDRLGEANSLKNLGEVNKLLDEYDKALQRYEEGLVIYRKIKLSFGEASIQKSIGDIFRLLDEYEKARHRYEAGLAIFREIKNRLGEANCLQRLAEVYLRLADYEKARQKYEEGLAIFRTIKARLGEANCLRGLGDMHMILSEYEQGRKRYEESLSIFREIKNRRGEANTLIGIADIHLRLAGYEKALQNYGEALAIYREIKHKLGEANCLQSIGDTYLLLSGYKKARQSYEEGLEIYRELKTPLGEASILQRLGNVHMSLLEFKKANMMYKQVLIIFRKLKDRLGEADILRSIADMHRMTKGYKKAIHDYVGSIFLQKEIGDRYGMVLSYNGLGQTFEALKDYNTAQKNYIYSINVIEEVWSEMKREEFKSHFFSSNISPYENLISLQFKQGKGSSAFLYSERSKARSILYLLGNKRIDPKLGVPENLAKEEEDLRRHIITVTKKIMENEKKEATRRISTKEMNEQLLQLKQKHSEVLEKIKLNSPEYASMLTVNPLSLEEIQALIREDKNTVLIEYYTTPDNLFMWLLDGKKIYPYKIDVTRKTLDGKIQEFKSMISDISVRGTTIKRSAQRLYNILLKPAEKFLNGKARIAMVPHGSLHYLPFEALMNKGKFLVEKNIKIFYLPSASVYKYCREKNKKNKKKVTAFVNPDGTLPGSEKEAETLTQLFPGRVEVFSGKKVTESMVKTNSGTSDILHFACHGKFESEHPLYSGLLLAPDNENDGRLEVSEIFQLQLKPAYLVTLSACETNVGNISPGDEIIGLTRAFIYAGTPSILASLWKVDDLHTAKLMASFYRELKNADKIDALHAARLEIINEPGKRHPFYWAAFVLIGDPR